MSALISETACLSRASNALRTRKRAGRLAEPASDGGWNHE